MHNELVEQSLTKCTQDLLEKGIIKFDATNQKYYIDKNYLLNLTPSYGFEDVAIKQKKNICSSRLDVNITSEVLREVFLEVPMVASNMSTVVDSQVCIKLHKLGALGVMHRAGVASELLNEVTKISKECDWTAASIGVDKEQFAFAKALIKAGANILCIDIAHGYSDSVFNLAKKIKAYSKNTKLILGNTTNIEMLKECSDFTDAIKVGIAQGFACETKNTAGCTEKQFSAIYNFKEASMIYGVPIISDGGIREPADFTKAIGAGANSIMAGKIFAACPDSAAETVQIDGVSKKLYAGMASRYVQNKWKGGLKDGTCPEGGVRYLDIGESLEKVLERYSGALKSGITYAGGKDIKTFQNTVEFVKI